jgi:hypothetical protein
MINNKNLRMLLGHSAMIPLGIGFPALCSSGEEYAACGSDSRLVHKALSASKKGR